ncbi:MAG: S8 family serine peptidase [Candidatus Saliniplasma sp.]
MRLDFIVEEENNMKIDKQSMAILAIIVLLVSVISAGIVMSSGEAEDDIVMVRIEEETDIDAVKRHDLNILEQYDNYVLVRASEEDVDQLSGRGLGIKRLPARTEISVKGHNFDIREGTPEFSEDLMIDDYESGEEGQYIVHMLGPIADNWRPTLEDKGVQVLNYVHNYGYRVRMTPEMAEEVSELYFVDWVGIYQPEYKLEQGLKKGVIDIGMVPDASMDSLGEIREKVPILSLDEVSDGEIKIRTIVDSEETLHEIAKIRDVSYISEFDEPELHAEVDSQIIGGGAWILDNDDDPSTPYREHGNFGAYINQMGYDGSGVVVSVADTGFGDGSTPDAGHPDFDGRVIGGHTFGTGGWEDGHGHGTHCAGSVAGNTHDGTGLEYAGHGPYYLADGLAYESELYPARIFDGGGSWIGPSDYLEILEVPKQNADAYVSSNSWGSDSSGSYGDADSAYDAGVRDADRDTAGNQPIVATISAGNSGSGEQTTGSPGNGKNVITIGAADSYMPDAGSYGNDHTTGDNPDDIAGFSSRGWTADNRIKPDVVAPGSSILSTSTPEVASSNLYGLYSEDSRYEWCDGTSMSNPAAAGAAAVTTQWYESNYGERPNPAMVKALMINTAHDLDDANGNTDPIPNKDEGWGMIDLSKLEYPASDPVSFYLEDQTSTFTDSTEEDEYQVMPESMDEPLKFSLVWTDKEADAGTGEGDSLINDLNLEVESPGGDIYRGNAFQNGWTEANTDTIGDFDDSGDGWDDTNTVENVYIPEADVEDGLYTVRVRAENIADDAVGIGENSQDYALVGYNGMDEVPGDPPQIDLTRPVGGEVWQADTQEDITWDTTAGDDPIDYVNLYYSVDGGTSFETIATEVADTGSYTWNIPNEDSTTCQVRAQVVDEVGRTNESVSGDFTIEGVPPAPPENLNVEHYGRSVQALFEDDVSEDLGYTTGESDPDASQWGIRQHGSAVGNNSWDFGDGQFYKDSSTGRLSWLISPQIEIPVEADSEYGVNFTFQHWRDWGDTSQYDAGNVKISTEGSDGPWTLITPQEGYDGTVPTTWDNPLGGEEAWGGTSDWTTATFDLTEYIGETIHLRWDAGVESYDGLEGPGWRIDDIYMEALISDPNGTDHNQVSWDASPDDSDEVGQYNIYRSADQSGPWDGTTLIDSVPADGSVNYSYLDEDRGEVDDTYWWYVVRAEGENGLEEENADAVQEPGAGTSLFDISLVTDTQSDDWNFVSFNLVPGDTSLTAILDDADYGIDGNYDKVMYYDASTDEWLSYIPGRDNFNDDIQWDETKGLWIQMNTDDTLTVEGTEPTSTDITLNPGWNMVSYPSSTAAVEGTPTEVTIVGHFDAAQDNNLAYDYDPANFEFNPGEGYYLYNDADYDVNWSVEY